MFGQARIVEYALHELCRRYGVRHDEDVAFLRGTIEDVVALTCAYLTDHPEPVRWAEPDPPKTAVPEPRTVDTQSVQAS